MVNKKKLRKNKKIQEKPFVTLCTPTFNRRPFIHQTIQNIKNQTYPHDRMEWIIIDDGTDKIEDLVCDIDFIKVVYKKYDEKMSLGKKRNLMHSFSNGEFIVYMDDDDYYPPERVSHAVSVLQKNPKALCAGSSEIYIWFKHIQSMYQFGPYNEQHATAGTFAMRRELLKQTSYEENAALAEEKHFLKNYTIPFAQLDPLKTILVFSHIHNTFDKKTLIQGGETEFCKKSSKKVDLFVKYADIRDFYMNKIDDLLKNYEPGQPKYKPDVLKQTKELKEKREKEMMNRMTQKKTGIVMKRSDGTSHDLTIDEIKILLNKQQTQLNTVHLKMKELVTENAILKEKIKEKEERGNSTHTEVKVIQQTSNNNDTSEMCVNHKRNTEDEFIEL
mgnify:CR=1 FL=1